MRDIIIVGAGIVGLATALKLIKKYPEKKILVLDKEKDVAHHQTGNNSGVIHSGLYYKPGSLKARNCVNGYNQLVKFCEEQEVPFELCGKIVVATKVEELDYLTILKERGKQNGLDGLRDLKAEELKEYEPHVRGVAGLFVPQTGIVDYKQVADKYLDLFRQAGGEIAYDEEVTGIFHAAHQSTVETVRSTFHTHKLINCAGLYSDKMARISSDYHGIRIIPFRGEYYKLKKDREFLVKNLVYPVPNPNFPFLGVHFTRMIHGGVEAGPNAVLAFKKEGYKRTDLRMSELLDSLSWPGFMKVASKYWQTGMGEMYRSFSKSAFTRALQQLVPEISSGDLEDGGAGVRAQACDRDGGLLDDFLILQDEYTLNVCNAPSPAATSSLAIADEIVSRTDNWM